MKNKKKVIIVIILVCLLLLSVIFSVLVAIKNNTRNVQGSIGNELELGWRTEEQLEEAEIVQLKNMTEKKRMQTYFSKYLSYMEEENYEQAYNLLYDEFKQNYFPTIEEYIEYVEKTYPKMLLVNYENMERQGKYFILDTTITGTNEQGETVKIEQKFIVYEKDYNDFMMSFNVI